jgi:citrate synthase
MTKTPSTTRICGYDPDTVSIRGKDLVTELMGRVSFTEMILFQLTGNTPGKSQVAILDAVLVTIMEHGLVPSAVVARLTHYGAPESIQGAVAAGLLGVGDRFAGTASECAEVLAPIAAAPEVNRLETARATVRSYRERKRPIPGFGHTIHRKEDPRAKRLVEIVTAAGTKGDFLRALAMLEDAVEQELGRKLVTNVSAAIGAALGEAGVPAKAVRGIVLTARCAGLAGHIYEEMNNSVSQAMWDAAESAVDYEPP